MKLYVVNADSSKLHLCNEKEMLDEQFKYRLDELKNKLKNQYINIYLLHTGFLLSAVYISENDANRSILVNGDRIEGLLSEVALPYRYFDGTNFNLEYLTMTWTEIVRDDLKENN